MENTKQLNAGSQKLKYYSQDSVKDPYAQVSNSGFTPIGNIKTYGVANLYDRPEPTKLRDIRELYTVPFATTPFLGGNVPSRKYIDVDSETLRYPVFQNRKSAIDTSQITIYPKQVFIKNKEVSDDLNNYYEQFVTVNLLNKDDQIYSKNLDPTLAKLGQEDDGLDNYRYINRWHIVDPKVTQNVEHIVMNVKSANGDTIGLHSCGVSSRNQLRNYVEINKC